MLETTEKQYIYVKGARSHNLKNIFVNIPRNALTVFTGPSGSGKSSLAFNTIFAEGQRRYVESLSSYARQFLDKMPPPDVDAIEGIPPAVAIEQKTGTKQLNSTVGTITEIYDYLKLLFARIGKTISPISREEVKQHTAKDVIDCILTKGKGLTVFIIVPINLNNGRDLAVQLDIYHSQGYGRMLVDNNLIRFDRGIDTEKFNEAKEICLVVDRFLFNDDDSEVYSRLADSVSIGFHEGNGKLIVRMYDEIDDRYFNYEFSNTFEADGMRFELPTPQLFAFNNPYGACPTCEGYGTVLGIDEDLVIPDKTLSVWEDAVVCWKGQKLSEWKDYFIKTSAEYSFPIHTPICELTETESNLLWNGNAEVYGIQSFFQYVEKKAYKIQYRVILSRYRGRTKCPECYGTRVRKEAQYVKVCSKSISDLVVMPVDELIDFFQNIKLDEYEQQISQRIVTEIRNRLSFLFQVGLSYLTLNRASNTLSGGETQRIHLAQAVGSNLVGALYIIDEPTVGLHPKDTQKLIQILLHLKDLGNTVIIVEHDEEIIQIADYIVDLGPLAGSLGGEVVYSGNFIGLLSCNISLTAKYFTKAMHIPMPMIRRKFRNTIVLKGAYENNLKHIDISFPLQIFTVITGPSGSGKTTLVKKILYPALKSIFADSNEKPGKFKSIKGDIHLIKGIEFIDQNPIGKSSRSNPVTYVKAFDDIRTLFCNLPLSKKRNYKPGFFSFNTVGGRCETCKGEGVIVVEMQFLADVELVCEDCNGKRYKEETLDILLDGKSISQILEMTIDEGIDFFRKLSDSSPSILLKHIIQKIIPLQEIGLGYLKMGQATSTLSGGEIQRLKLGSFLVRVDNVEPLLFIFDEPTTGLHYHDIIKLQTAFEKLLHRGHSLIIIEHNMEIIKCADWIIDLGPEGGKHGGQLVFEGTPEELLQCEQSHTAHFLKQKFIN